MGIFDLRRKRLLLVPLSCAILLSGLTGCNHGNGDGDELPVETSTISGTAAFGAAISGGRVRARCVGGGGFSSTVTTTAQGAFSGVVPTAGLPCALQVTGGNLPAGYGALHSLARSAGTVNITPLTDLALALSVNAAAGESLAAWFADPSRLADVGSGLAAAQSQLRTALETAGYEVPEDFQPLTASFTPDPATDAYDRLLESIAAAIEDSATFEDYADLLEAFVANSEPALPIAPEEPIDPGADTVPGTVNAALVKTFTLVFKQGGGAGCGTDCGFTEDQQVVVIVGDDNSLSIAGKQLTNPFNRKLFGDTPHLPEIIWKDGAIEYALSDNQEGIFNEINVGKARAGGGIPSFIGQLRSPPPSNDPAEKLKPLAGNYAPVLFEKSGNFAGNSKPALDAPVPVQIAETGSVTIDGFTFDPAAEGFEFFENLRPNALEPGYTLSIREDETNTLSLTIHLMEGEPVSWKLGRTTQIGSGSFATNSILLEERPLPEQETALLTALRDKGSILLTAVLDDTGYASGYEKCERIVLKVSGNSAASSPWLYKLEETGGNTIDQETYKRSYGRYSEESGNQRIAFTRQRLVQRSDGHTDAEGIFLGNVRDRATSDPAQIAAAGCALE